jgi:hypothetical protein
MQIKFPLRPAFAGSSWYAEDQATLFRNGGMAILSWFATSVQICLVNSLCERLRDMNRIAIKTSSSLPFNALM